MNDPMSDGDEAYDPAAYGDNTDRWYAPLAGPDEHPDDELYAIWDDVAEEWIR